MVAEVFVLFFPVSLEINGGSYTIAVLGNRHTELILMRICLTVICLFLEVFMQFPYSLPSVHLTELAENNPQHNQ